MFDINGGGQNVLIFLGWLISFIIIVVGPLGLTTLSCAESMYKRYFMAIVFILCFLIWFAMLYLANPSMALWK